MRYRSTRLLVAGAGVVLVAVLAGCGDGTPDAAPQSASPTDSARESSGAQPTSGPSNTSSQPPGGTSSRPGSEQDGSQQTAASCDTGDVKVTLGKGDATAGSYYAPLRFTNSGDEPCVIAGYPGVSYVAGENAHQVGPAAARVGSDSPAVRLAPGEVAHATVRFLRVRNYPAQACEPTDVRALRVYPPGETAWELVSHSGTGCAGDDMSGPQLTVKPVQPGPGGRQG